jgi:hypothetical protein
MEEFLESGMALVCKLMESLLVDADVRLERHKKLNVIERDVGTSREGED